MLKRIFDIILSLFFILIFLPFGLIISIILKFTGEKEIFYLQKRIGKEGKEIKIFKFTTMLKNSEQIGAKDITLENDSRVLPFGKFLRKTKLNEVPQLINILLGSMSFVGPRPLTPKVFNYYSEEIKSEIKSLKPGLTGIGSIYFRNEELFIGKGNDFVKSYKDKIVPYKGQLELWYKKHHSFLLDCFLIFLTALVVLFPSFKDPLKCFKDLPVYSDYANCD